MFIVAYDNALEILFLMLVMSNFLKRFDIIMCGMFNSCAAIHSITSANTVAWIYKNDARHIRKVVQSDVCIYHV